MFKERLLTPGPTIIPQKVLQAMELPMLHHRSDVFKKELLKACEGIRWLLSWDNDPLFLACSGTGAMEASLLNVCKPGDTIITVNGGVFGARWAKIAERLQLTAHEIVVEWGTPVTEAQVHAAITQHPGARAFCIQHSETSTTVLHPVERIVKTVKQLAPSMLTLVDGISACATTPLPGDTETVDIFIAGSQKALMLPPGLSVVALSERAWKAVEETPRRSLYFDFQLERKSLLSGETSWTPTSTLIVGLNAAIEMFRAEGLSAMYKRHLTLSRMSHVGMSALGCTLLATDAPCPSVTGFLPPNGIDADKLRNEVRNSYSIRLAGGQGAFKGKIIRIGHMGFVDPFDVLAGVTAIGLTLHKLGASTDVAKATSAMTIEMER
jgi:aspartate aminotransferase-like enzyme